MKIFDTISAIATPIGKGGVALIRISGDNAMKTAEKIFKSASGKLLSEYSSNTSVYGKIYAMSADGKKTAIDDVMAVYFKSPRSFTGEDTVEISCHGGVLITKCVLEATLAAGARLAEAGEFTRRAFLAGKLDLSEAEALGSLLEAKNINQLELARGTMSGKLTDRSRDMYEKLRAMLGNIYAKIDFPDEDLSEMSTERMTEILSRTLEEIEKLCKTYRTAYAVNEGIKTVICGRTNAGKSSVYNRLTGCDSAIVTDIEGTTRDILRETVTLGKVTLRISDTAGLRSTDNAVEEIGIQRAISEIDTSELILAVFDVSKPLSEDDISLIEKLSSANVPTIALINKTDLAQKSESSDRIEQAFNRTVYVSAKTGEGFDRLEQIVNSLFIDGNINLSEDAIVSGARQHTALIRAAEAIRSALDSINNGVSLDLCCIDIESAMQLLGELEGREVGEDVVSEIFSKFCVGK